MKAQSSTARSLRIFKKISTLRKTLCEIDEWLEVKGTVESSEIGGLTPDRLEGSSRSPLSSDNLDAFIAVELAEASIARQRAADSSVGQGEVTAPWRRSLPSGE